MKQLSCRLGMGVVLGGFLLLAPALGWGACGEEAQRYYEKGTQVSRKYTDSGKPCGEECLEEKRYFYRRAVELCPSYAEAHNNLGDVLEKLGRYPEARTHYLKAIELKPALAAAYFGLGDLYFRTMEYARAVEAYNKGLKVDPDDPLAKKQREVALRLQGREAPDAETLKEVLGGGAITVMGPAGIKPDRRIPLRIPFALDSDRLLPEAQNPLHELGTAMKDILESFPSAAFLIEGHADLQGPEDYNRELSEKRAKSVAGRLVEVFRIPPDRLGIKGYGEGRPIRTGSSKADHAFNRRVEVVRLEVDELKAYSGIQRVRGALPRESTSLAVDVGVFYEDAEFRPRKLEEGAALRSGGGYRLYLEPHQPCYVYIFQIDSSGKLFHLYPNPDYGSHDNFVQAGAKQWVPGGDQWLELDHTRGKEEIYVVATRERREDIEDLFTRYSRSDHPGSKENEKKELTVELGNNMGTLPKPRPGRNVKVTSTTGRTAELTTDQLRREGVGFAYRFAFHHE